MTKPQRSLLPWEAHCGCPTCKVKPGSRCVTCGQPMIAYEPDRTAHPGCDDGEAACSGGPDA